MGILNNKQLEHLAGEVDKIAVGQFALLSVEPIAALISGNPLNMLLGGKFLLALIFYLTLQGLVLVIKGKIDEP